MPSAFSARAILGDKHSFGNNLTDPVPPPLGLSCARVFRTGVHGADELWHTVRLRQSPRAARLDNPPEYRLRRRHPAAVPGLSKP